VASASFVPFSFFFFFFVWCGGEAARRLRSRLAEIALPPPLFKISQEDVERRRTLRRDRGCHWKVDE